MADALSLVKSEYAAALSSYLRERGEPALLKATTIGRQAMAANLGVLDMVIMHHACLAEVLGGGGDAIKAASEFLSETLSIYEVTHRGFQEATESFARVLEFASVVCHELRTPLTSIISSAGMLQEVLALDPQAAEGRLMANVLAGAAILKRRTDDLVDLVGLRAGILSLNPRRTDVGGLLHGLADRLAPAAAMAGITLSLDAPPELPTVIADPDRLEQVIANLVQNSLKYAGRGTSVVVSARPQDQGLVIEVSDNGAGIPLPQQKRVFQPHFRTNGKPGEVSGLGIGLALCKELVERHGGAICFHSEEGRGTVFRIELPGRERVEGAHH